MHDKLPIVRNARLEDLDVLQEFKMELIRAELPMDPTIKEDTTSYYDLAELITSGQSDLFVIEINSEIVASGYAQILDDRPYLKHEKQGYLGFMFVPEKHRGNGYNKLIVDKLLAWCKERKVYEIKLDVYHVNESALRAYEKAGFKKHLINMRLDISD
ncbi:MAG: RimJ/RimL family protein N-acetyltransferase [Candidatus Latescibacterota bacterium]|jgi:RimJ/RimL family protein N-acetyltransferase